MKATCILLLLLLPTAVFAGEIASPKGVETLAAFSGGSGNSLTIGQTVDHSASLVIDIKLPVYSLTISGKAEFIDEGDSFGVTPRTSNPTS